MRANLILRRLFALVDKTRESRRLGSTLSNGEPFHLTTPIFYVNGDPHLGHAYTAVLADCLHRWQRLKGAAGTRFSTGTDEHGAKVEEAARRSDAAPEDFCRRVSDRFRSTFDDLDVGYTDFVRTTDPRHADSVSTFWRRLADRGFLRKGRYGGWYSTTEEAFLVAPDVKRDEETGGFLCRATGRTVTWNEEENYLFELARFKEPLTRWLTENEIVQPKTFLPAVLGMIDEISGDLSVSRLRSKLSWGIPVPGDESQTIYVWLDALVNYLTAAGYPDEHVDRWPGTIHLVGKDILKFHAIYWPAFLMAAGLLLPRRIMVHSHWLVDHVKMSKSLGNVVDPRQLIEKVSADGLRYFLLAEGVPQQDGNCNEKKIIEKLNAELCNTFGNLLNRVTGKKLNPDQIFPSLLKTEFDDLILADPTSRTLAESLTSLPAAVDEAFDGFRVYQGCDRVMTSLREANQFLQHARPWTLDRQRDGARFRAVLFIVMESLRVNAILLQPVVPGLARQALDSLGVPEEDRRWSDSKPFRLGRGIEHEDRPLLPSKSSLYQRIVV